MNEEANSVRFNHNGLITAHSEPSDNRLVANCILFRRFVVRVNYSLFLQRFSIYWSWSFTHCLLVCKNCIFELQQLILAFSFLRCSILFDKYFCDPSVFFTCFRAKNGQGLYSCSAIDSACPLSTVSLLFFSNSQRNAPKCEMRSQRLPWRVTLRLTSSSKIWKDILQVQCAGEKEKESSMKIR